MAFIALIAVIIIFFYLQARINTLQEQVDTLRGAKQQPRTTANAAPQTSVDTSPTTPTATFTPQNVQHHAEKEASVPPPQPIITPAAPEPVVRQPHSIPPITPTEPTPNPFVEWWKQNTLIKVGAIIFFMGTVWFVSYAIAQGWISPVMRIVLGILLGTSVLAIGHLRRHVEQEQYLTLTTLGSGIIIASVYVGQLLFSVFDPLMALLILLATIAYTVSVSVLTNTQWLAVTAAIAALVAPLLTNAPAGLADLFFYYLVMITVCFLLVQRFRPWRSLPLTLALGVGYYQVAYYAEGVMNETTLWWYVIIFTIIFFAANAINLHHDDEPQPLDITLFGFIAVNFAGWVQVLASEKSLVTFTAAFIVAATGYLLYERQANRRTVSLYAGLAGLFVLLGTSFALDGYTLTIAFALEITIALMVASHLQFTDRLIGGVAWMYVLPLVTALSTYSPSDWRGGLWHDTGLSLYSIIITTFVISLWFVIQAKQQSRPLYHLLAGSFTVLCYAMFVLTVSNAAPATQRDLALVDSARAESIATVLMYCLWLTASIGLVAGTTAWQLSTTWLRTSFLSFLLPAIAALGSLASGAWGSGVIHPHATGSYLMVLVSLILLAYAVSAFERTKEPLWQTGALALIFYFWVYTCGLSWQVWGALLPNDAAVVVSYVSWALITFVLGLIVHHLRYPRAAWVTLQVLFAVPILASFSSLDYTNWQYGALDVQAAGLYVLTVLFFMMGMTYRREGLQHRDQNDHLLGVAKAFIVGGALYATAVVWVVTHAVLASSGSAVAVALFIYTVAGLACYLIGNNTNRADFKLASGLLLSGVVLRLILIDVWTMELLWRIVTFMGIGALFIATALVEKPFAAKPTTEEESFTPPAPPPQSPHQ